MIPHNSVLIARPPVGYWAFKHLPVIKKYIYQLLILQYTDAVLYHVLKIVNSSNKIKVYSFFLAGIWKL